METMSSFSMMARLSLTPAHYGHLITGYATKTPWSPEPKRDAALSAALLGYHGLPAELLKPSVSWGIEDVTEITRPGGIGIEKFNGACRSSVQRYTKGKTTSPARPAGWTSNTTTRP